MKRAPVVPPILILLVTSGMVIGTLESMPSQQSWNARASKNVIGPEAAELPLPVRTPHARPWPPARQWQEQREFGRRRVITWHVNELGSTTHQCQADYYGFPLPVLCQAQF